MAGALAPLKKGYSFLFEKKKVPTGVIGSALLFIMLVSVFSYSAASLKGELLTIDEIKDKFAGEFTDDGGDGPFEYDLEEWSEATGNSPAISAVTNENTEVEEQTDIIQENLKSVTFTLTWVDEADRNALWVNQPDSLGLSVSGPNGQNGSAPASSNVQGGEGMVSVTVDVKHDKPNDGIGSGAWNYTVIVGDCGDQNRRFRPSLIIFTDTVADWTLTIEYTYYQENSE